MITKKRAKISSLNFLCIYSMRLWLQLYKYIHDIIDGVTRSQNRSKFEIGINLRQYLSYSVDQKLKMSEMVIAIFLLYSTSGITSGKKSLSSSKWRPFWNFWNIKHSFNLTSDMKRSSQIMPKICFYVDDVIDDVAWWPQSFSLYSCLGEVGSGSKLQGQCLVNKCQYHNCLSRLYMPKTISMNNTFRYCRSKVNITGLLGDIGTNKQHCKLSQLQLFLRLWRHR